MNFLGGGGGRAAVRIFERQFCIEALFLVSYFQEIAFESEADKFSGFKQLEFRPWFIVFRR